MNNIIRSFNLKTKYIFKRSNKVNWATKFTTIVLITLSIWLGALFFGFEPKLIYPNMGWATFYQLMALIGTFWGLIAGRAWGGLKSVMGRSTIFFALGLGFQFLGQIALNMYGSLEDLSFLIGTSFYIYAILQLGRASGIYVSLRSFVNKIIALLLPIAVLVTYYTIFIRGHGFDWSNLLNTFIDFGYPFSQAIYISLVVLVYFLSANVFGGIMKNKVLFILMAITIQYVADLNFLYQNSHGVRIIGGYENYIYLASYLLMTISLIRLDLAVKQIRES